MLHRNRFDKRKIKLMRINHPVNFFQHVNHSFVKHLESRFILNLVKKGSALNFQKCIIGYQSQQLQRFRKVFTEPNSSGKLGTPALCVIWSVVSKQLFSVYSKLRFEGSKSVHGHFIQPRV